MFSVVQLKKFVADTLILGIIEWKFCHWWELCLIILLKVDQRLKIGSYSAILPLCLSVGLRVQGSKETAIDAKKIAKR